MRKLHQRSLRILKTAEQSKDLGITLAAIRECRRNLETIGRITGEINPSAPSEEAGGSGLQVTIVYANRPADQGNEPKRLNGPDSDVSSRFGTRKRIALYARVSKKDRAMHSPHPSAEQRPYPVTVA